MKKTALGRALPASSMFAVVSALMVLAACGDSGGTAGTGGSGGGGSSCEMVATSPGTWDITLEFAGGDPADVTGLTVAQSGCTVTMSLSDPMGDLSITGPLSDTGIWTAMLSFTDTMGGSYGANFSGTFSGGPPYTMITIMSGTDSEGDTITGGSGAITL